MSTGTDDFIQACYQELDRLRQLRQGLREDGLCVGWGVEVADWHEENNAFSEEMAQIHEILGWLEEECPLLLARAALAQRAAASEKVPRAA